MLDVFLGGIDGWTLAKVALAVIPTVTFIWIIVTVRALHRRSVYFWSLGSTWATIIGCPAGLLIASFSGLSGINDPAAAPFYPLVVAGLLLYVAASGYSLLYNYGVTKSTLLAISTTALQQLAVLGALFLLLRLNEGRRRHHGG